MVASRKKLKGQTAAGNAAAEKSEVKDPRVKVQKKKQKNKRKGTEKIGKAAAEAEAEAERLAELAAIEERKAAKKLKKEEKKRRKEAEGKIAEEEGLAVGKKQKKEVISSNGEENGTESIAEDGKLDPESNKPNKSTKTKNKKKKNIDRWGKAPAPTADPAEAEKDNRNEDTEQSEEFHPKRIYVGGMPYWVTEDEIQNYFSECGAIDEIDYVTFPDSGNFRGIAFITFKTEAAAGKALELDGADMSGRYLRIMRARPRLLDSQRKFAEPPSKSEGCTSVYVGNLSWETTEKELRSFFKGCNIARVRLAVNRETSEFKGFGHVDFDDDDSVERAVALDQTTFLGRSIKIAYAVPNKPSGGGGGESRAPRKRFETGCFACGGSGHKSMNCPNENSIH